MLEKNNEKHPARRQAIGEIMKKIARLKCRNLKYWNKANAAAAMNAVAVLRIGIMESPGAFFNG